MKVFRLNFGSVYEKLTTEVKPKLIEFKLDEKFRKVFEKNLFKDHPRFKNKIKILKLQNAWELLIYFFNEISYFELFFNVHIDEAPFRSLIYYKVIDEEDFTEDELKFIEEFTNLQNFLNSVFTEQEKKFLYAISKNYDKILIKGEEEKKLKIKIDKKI